MDAAAAATVLIAVAFFVVLLQDVSIGEYKTQLACWRVRRLLWNQKHHEYRILQDSAVRLTGGLKHIATTMRNVERHKLARWDA